ncbi:serine/threonine-protein kinase [Colwellia sp. E2M01]|uniref:serine/threonine-protein kinase n=1 Tax=Colwellia sp. E2M01 TaxID=2841561 RepID=UPI001C099BF3|nr:serine/threonine-protein kinase [Colwellia sp. E2M01]MBU2870472.1 serine/threonine protein kinase [Colwellia sp. E2M01]
MENTQSTASVIDDKTLIAGVSPQKTAAPINLIGKSLKDRYLIESLIGSGGMSDIYRAKDLHLEAAGINEPYVAIKVLLQQYSSIPEAKQILIKEARKTQQLSHPNIIRVYDVDSHDNFHFIVMEWLDGETLDQVIKRSKPMGLPFKGANNLIQQIGEALTYAHKMGIVHTDLKPSNIILTRQGNIKIFDFGIASAVQLNFDKYAIQNNDLSSPLTGYTPAYASFEQLEGQSPCTADDIFAFSCIVYELLSCKHPYQRVAANKVDLQKTSLKKPKHLNLLLWPSLKKGLAIHKEQRCNSIQKINNDFSRKVWPKALAITTGIVITAAALQVYQAQEKEIDNLNNLITLSDDEQKKLNGFKNLSTIDLLAQLENIPAEQRLLKQGLLREHRQSLINIAEKRIINVTKDATGTYKDYEQVNQIIENALAIFPDSIRLSQLQAEASSSRIAIIDALSERLNILLLQGRYNETGDNNIDKIIADLKFVDFEFKFQPKDDVFKVYNDAFTLALTEHNIDRITRLISVGELAFAYHSDAKALLDLGKEIKSSVALLAKYNADINNGKPVNYPYDAAEVFYASTFDQFNEDLSLVETPTALMKIDEKITELESQIPSDFTPLIAVKKIMAGSYLNYGNLYIEKKRFKTAKQLIKRGNELYTLIN